MIGFKHVGNFMNVCETCGAKVPSGLMNIVNHWNECAGKGMTDALIKAREIKNAPITMEDVRRIIKDSEHGT
jgi:hypothetical protein